MLQYKLDMKESSTESSVTPSSPASPLEVITKKGDELDIIERGRVAFPIALTALEGVAALIPMSHRSVPTADVLITYPAYATAGLIAAKGISTVAKLISRRNLQKIGEQQELVRKTCPGEPIDIFRVGRGKDRSLAVRWYGIDAEDDPTGKAGRLRKVADWAEKAGIAQLAVGADNLSLDANNGSTDYGPIIDADSKYADNLKRRRAAMRLEDPSTDKTVLVMTPDKARQLAQALEKDRDTSTLARLVSLIRIVEVRDEYDKFREDRTSSDALLGRLRRAVQMDLDAQVEGEVTEIVNAYGHRDSHIDTASYSVIGGNIFKTFSSRFRNREHVGRPGSSCSVLAYLNEKNLDDLVAKAFDPTEELAAPRRALYAAYLMVHNKAEDDNKQLELLHGKESVSALCPRTTLQKLHEKEVTAVDMSLRAKARRSLAAAALVTVATIGGGVAGMAMDAVDSQLYGKYIPSGYDAWWRTKAQIDPTVDGDSTRPPSIYGPEGHSPEFKEFLDSSTPHRIAYEATDVYERLWNADTNLSVMLAQLYLNKFGWDPDIIRSTAADRIDEEWLRTIRERLTVPEELLTAAMGESLIGDVPGKSNKELYRITSLTGRESAGLWYTDTLNSVEVLRTPGPPNTSLPGVSFRDAVVKTPKSLDVPHDNESIQTLQPDFRVDTPYISVDAYKLGDLGGVGKATSLPIIAGGEVVAARITDSANPNTAIAVKVSKSEDNMYSVKLDITKAKDMAAYRVTKPILQYWVKMSDTPPNHYDSAFSWPAGNKVGTGYEPIDTGEVAKSVKKALGLEETATDEEVYKTIASGRAYSYTPFASQGSPIPSSRNFDSLDYQAILTEWGTVMAGLESMNCNVASATALLATQAGKGTVNQAVGFMNDGDDSLSQKEAHAWLIDSNGTAIDPTPRGKSLYPVEKADLTTKDSTPNSPLPLKESFAVAALLVLGAIQRKRIATVVGSALVTELLGRRSTEAAYKHALTVAYARPGTTPCATDSGRELSRLDLARGITSNFSQETLQELQKGLGKHKRSTSLLAKKFPGIAQFSALAQDIDL
jgi:hypothetical protein